ncbi:MAG: radical SAM family heme chaperone HemW [Oscillospiraceae bacterium]|nr:radical SAM family heme chaperone HemW [Oscillospiraceae bacterium]
MKAAPPSLGLYIHIPFCKSKCAYCDFYSLPRCESEMDAYCGALAAHLTETAPRCESYAVDTVYFGGGTPSYLGAKRLCRLLKTVKKHYALTRDAEITFEANPDSAKTVKDLKALRKAGFNRISLGVQSTDDALLHAIGRIHTFADVKEAVSAARKAGFMNISCDLIFGLPNQTMAHWQKTLEDILALEVEHLSCYGLMLEEGTPLYEKRESLVIPDDDAQADMYLFTVDYLAAHGYAQYEISNFAKAGFPSRHNLRYWQLKEYAGFGPGAHSDLGGVRFAYEKDLASYLRGELKLSESEAIAARERDGEYLMLSLRMAEGVSPAEYEKRFRRPFAPLEKALAPFMKEGLAEKSGENYRLTAKGFLLSNSIIAALLDEQQRQKARRADPTDFTVFTER